MRLKLANISGSWGETDNAHT